MIVVALYLVVGYALSQTAWGRHVYAVGDDRRGRRLSGVRSLPGTCSASTAVAGLIYGIAGWALIGRAGAASPNAIVDANLDSNTRS